MGGSFIFGRGVGRGRKFLEDAGAEASKKQFFEIY